MVKIKSLCMVTAICATSSLYAQTGTQTQPYGDNPNIFRVLAHKTGEAVQNTAEKVGDATEKGIQKIKPSFDETIENTKKYTSEQATIARDNTRQGIDTAVKKVEQTKDRVMGNNSYNVPIEQGSLSQSSTTANSANPHTVANVPNISNQIIANPSTQESVAPSALKTQASQNIQSDQQELEIKKQSLPIENQSNMPSPSSTDSTRNDDTNIPADDEAGVPR
ncbi:hypothetical protein [Acinetobacter nematophilus]|uniref:Uncharacterized protein n=1 Tax=Acinetobacter nematophilus TaxID=2994642 RepID=A0A9X3DW65_9GAMM|nr:hypothetical protein [Acinetobacter nematophilus]MCX5468326.1 hypothetical protein [Acinetobacter nematophilus]